MANNYQGSNTMNAEQLLNAYREYAAAYQAWESNFDATKLFDLPEAPTQSLAARAGEVIHERGMAGALKVAELGIEDPDCPERTKESYQLIIEAAR
jgi:hypothetical protein